MNTRSAKTVTKFSTKTTPKKTTSRPTSTTVDPLYVIFEQHLFNFADPDSDRPTFIGNVVSDYINYLRKNNIIVPKSLEQPIVEELSLQVNTMLVKKIYGCVTVGEFVDTLTFTAKKKAKTRYKKLERKAG